MKHGLECSDISCQSKLQTIFSWRHLLRTSSGAAASVLSTHSSSSQPHPVNFSLYYCWGPAVSVSPVMLLQWSNNITGSCSTIGFFKQLVELLKLIAVSVLSRFVLDCLLGTLISCQLHWAPSNKNVWKRAPLTLATVHYATRYAMALIQRLTPRHPITCYNCLLRRRPITCKKLTHCCIWKAFFFTFCIQNLHCN